MSFKAISFSLVAAAALLAQPAFAQGQQAGVVGGTVAGVSTPLIAFGVVAAATLVTANDTPDAVTATATATATR